LFLRGPDCKNSLNKKALFETSIYVVQFYNW
jgi:hypothetical protein